MKNISAFVALGILALILSITVFNDSNLKLYGIGLSILLLSAGVVAGLKRKS